MKPFVQEQLISKIDQLTQREEELRPEEDLDGLEPQLPESAQEDDLSFEDLSEFSALDEFELEDESPSLEPEETTGFQEEIENPYAGDLDANATIRVDQDQLKHLMNASDAAEAGANKNPGGPETADELDQLDLDDDFLNEELKSEESPSDTGLNTPVDFPSPLDPELEPDLDRTEPLNDSGEWDNALEDLEEPRSNWSEEYATQSLSTSDDLAGALADEPEISSIDEITSSQELSDDVDFEVDGEDFLSDFDGSNELDDMLSLEGEELPEAPETEEEEDLPPSAAETLSPFTEEDTQPADHVSSFRDAQELVSGEDEITEPVEVLSDSADHDLPPTQPFTVEEEVPHDEDLTSFSSIPETPSDVDGRWNPDLSPAEEPSIEAEMALEDPQKDFLKQDHGHDDPDELDDTLDQIADSVEVEEELLTTWNDDAPLFEEEPLLDEPPTMEPPSDLPGIEQIEEEEDQLTSDETTDLFSAETEQDLPLEEPPPAEQLEVPPDQDKEVEEPKEFLFEEVDPPLVQEDENEAELFLETNEPPELAELDQVITDETYEPEELLMDDFPSTGSVVEGMGLDDQDTGPIELPFIEEPPSPMEEPELDTDPKETIRTEEARVAPTETAEEDQYATEEAEVPMAPPTLPPPLPQAPVTENTQGPATLSDEQLDKLAEAIASKLLRQIDLQVLREVAWEIIPPIAENLIKETIDQLKSASN
jgi:hypothetical protein